MTTGPPEQAARAAVAAAEAKWPRRRPPMDAAKAAVIDAKAAVDAAKAADREHQRPTSTTAS